MIPAERQKTLLNLISKQSVISINNLVNILGVSHMTVRRDIQKLEEDGKVISVSGGVQLLERLSSEPTHDDKSLLATTEKTAISKKAVELIQEHSTIYLDAGTTTLEIAKQIANRNDLLVITNDFVIAHYLMVNSQCNIMHTGGLIKKSNRSSVGEFAAQFLHQISVDIAFISTSSWNLKGLTTPDEQKIPVKKAIIQFSQKNILVTDSSKYGKVATFLLYPLSSLDTIICDKGLPENAQARIAEMNVELFLV